MKVKSTMYGYPISQVKTALLSLQSDYTFGLSDYLNDTGLSLIDAQKLILALLKDELIEIIKHDFLSREQIDEMQFPTGFQLTPKGTRVLATKMSHRMKRSAIEKLLKTVLQRAQESKTAPFLRYEPDIIVVYGSFNKEQNDYGDLDLAISYTPKLSDFKGSEGFTHEQLKHPFLGWEPLNNYQELMDNIRQRIYLAWEMYESKSVTFRPSKPDMYAEYMWDLKAVNSYIKRANHRISIETLDTIIRALDTPEVTLVYCKVLGGVIDPKPILLKDIENYKSS